MQCPRDSTDLIEERMHGIEVDHCPTCNGRWLDHHELDELEATRSDEGERRGTIRFSERDSELRCPVCDEPMAAFNYRAYDLEVRDIIDERVRDLKRSSSAEAAWGEFLDGLGGRGGGNGGAWGSVRRFFGGGRR